MGAGFDQEKSDSRIYANLVGNADNNAEGGSSNLKIFTRAAKALIDRQHNAYFVQWSALHRHWLYPSPKHGFYIGSHNDQNLIDKNFVAQYQLLNHDYSNIMSLIDYTRILQQLAVDAKKPIWFINGMLPWTQDMLLGGTPSKYAHDLYQGLDPDEIQDFATRLRNNLELLNWDQWINPWYSISNLQQDNAPLDTHPGPATHKKIANMINQRIDTQRENT